MFTRQDQGLLRQNCLVTLNQNTSLEKSNKFFEASHSSVLIHFACLIKINVCRDIDKSKGK